MAERAKQDRKYLGVLYPDSESYSCDEVIEELKKTFPQFAMILHDKDCDENGELKKPHIHWVGRFRAPRSLDAVADEIGVPSNMIERCRSFDAAIRYLIHADNPEKYHYPIDSVFSTFPLSQFFRDDEEVQASKIITYIDEQNCCSVVSLVRWSLSNGCWGVLRSGGSLWTSCISEKRIMNIREVDARYLYPHDVDGCIVYDPIERCASIPDQMLLDDAMEDLKK